MSELYYCGIHKLYFNKPNACPECKSIDNITITIAEYEAMKGYKEKYYELVMGVGNKYPNESRHETAKRYIVRAETLTNVGAGAAIKEGN